MAAGMVTARPLGKNEFIAVEPGVLHPKRVEDSLTQKIGVFLAADFLDYRAKDDEVGVCCGG